MKVQVQLKATCDARWLRRMSAALMLFAGLVSAGVCGAAEVTKVAIGESLELALKVRGHGATPVIFLHGYSLSMDTWDKVIDKFPADVYKTYTYDLRGFGDSSKPATGNTMNQHAQDLAALMDKLKLPRAVLIGHSLGGAIGQEFATLYPDRVMALVTSDAFARYIPLPGVSEALRKRAEGFGTIEQSRELLKGAVPRYFDPRNQNPADIERFIAITLKSSTAALRDQLIDAYAAPALDANKYRNFRMPVLAASGAVDYVVPVTNAIALSDVIPEAELLLVPRVGHSPMWERPDAWAQPVLEFLHRRLAASR